MSFRILLCFSLLSIMFAVPLSAQEKKPLGPVTKREVSVWLRLAPQTRHGIAETNRKLTEQIKVRGVDFALSKEEEWAFHLQDASPDLIAAVRNAFTPEEREKRLKGTQQQGIFNTFITNYQRNDLTSRNIALAAGREFINRYRSDTNVRDKIQLIEQNVPALERSVRTMSRPTRSRVRRN